MAYDEDFDDVMERKNKGSTICPVCFHEMTYHGIGKEGSWICLDCGNVI